MIYNKLSFVSVFSISVIGFAQNYNGKIGVNTDQPKATLDINIAETNKNHNTNEGILIPRLDKKRLAKIDDSYLVEGTLVYISQINTPDTANPKVENVLANGFHYYDGKVWQPIQKPTPKFDYILSLDGSVLTMWFNKYVDTIDMTQYSDMADVTHIAPNLMQNSQVKKFVLKDGVTTIGTSAFANNPDMEISTLPTSITTIENNAFQNNTKITQVHLPNLTTIGQYAFSDNTAITSVDLPIIKEISNYAFYGNTALTNISLPQATTIGDSAFRNNTALTNISLPQATTIGGLAFFENTSLTSINLPQATTIEDWAFKGTALTNISLPQVTTIGEEAFRGNTALTSVKLSSNIKKIGYEAFINIASNAVITIESTTPPELLLNLDRRTGWFDSTTTIKVPMASVETYKTAWAKYADQIVGY